MATRTCRLGNNRAVADDEDEAEKQSAQSSSRQVRNMDNMADSNFRVSF